MSLFEMTVLVNEIDDISKRINGIDKRYAMTIAELEHANRVAAKMANKLTIAMDALRQISIGLIEEDNLAGPLARGQLCAARLSGIAREAINRVA